MNRTIRLLLLFLLLIVPWGCGRKAPPALPVKPSSLILILEAGEQDLSKERAAFLGERWKEVRISPYIDGSFGEMG